MDDALGTDRRPAQLRVAGMATGGGHHYGFWSAVTSLVSAMVLRLQVVVAVREAGSPGLSPAWLPTCASNWESESPATRRPRCLGVA